MYAVIFTSRIKHLDPEYSQMVAQLRELAINKYQCTKIDSYGDGDNECTISYWESLQHIQAWKKDPLHAQAQQLGRDSWYQSYSIQVVEIKREYSWATKSTV